MNVPVCSQCWCPHSMASPCGASAGRIVPAWRARGGEEQQRIADRAERIAIDRFLWERHRR